MVEYSVINGIFSSITLDLLPKNFPLRRISLTYYDCTTITMVDTLNKAIRAMSLEEEEPLILPDSPSFRVFDENETSLLGRLLNPE